MTLRAGVECSAKIAMRLLRTAGRTTGLLPNMDQIAMHFSYAGDDAHIRNQMRLCSTNAVIKAAFG